MTGYTDEELTQLFRGLESDTVERRRSWAGRVGIRKNVCAFANDLPGNQKPGVIFVGAAKDGSCADIRVDARLLHKLAKIGSGGAILPIPSVNVQKLVVDGCEVAALIVQPSTDAPVRYDGRVWVKVGPTVQLANPDEERWLRERSRTSDRTLDLRLSDARIRDLDLPYIEDTYIPRAASMETLRSDQRTLQDRLQALHLVYRDRPTRGAMIAFGQAPQRWVPGATVQFLRFQGNSRRTPVVMHKSIDGQIQQVIGELDRLITTNIRTSSNFTSAPQKVTKPDYPREAIEHLAHNAIMHRSYEQSDTSVRIHWYSDRVVVRSPGGLYGSVRPENIERGVTSYRNPLIAKVMCHLGFAQQIGLGLQIARDAMKANGNPPIEFDFAPMHVRATLRSTR